MIRQIVVIPALFDQLVWMKIGAHLGIVTPSDDGFHDGSQHADVWQLLPGQP